MSLAARICAEGRPGGGSRHGGGAGQSRLRGTLTFRDSVADPVGGYRGLAGGPRSDFFGSGFARRALGPVAGLAIRVGDEIAMLSISERPAAVMRVRRRSLTAGGPKGPGRCSWQIGTQNEAHHRVGSLEGHGAGC